MNPAGDDLPPWLAPPIDAQPALPRDGAATGAGGGEDEVAAILSALARLRERPAAHRLELGPRRWGSFELLSLEGSGVSSEVYRARDLRLERVVALKLGNPATSRLAASRAAILSEGRLLARLDHPNVARVYGVHEHDGRLGLSVELVEGETLAAMAQRSLFSARATAAAGAAVCDALAALHARHILHRDVKAQNVIREAGGRIVLVDLGIALDLERDAGEASLSGTPLYMAPELLAGGDPTPWSDLYSTGVLLYFLLTGRFPVEAETMAGLWRAHADRRQVPLARRRRGIPWRLQRLVESCLHPWPEMRPPGARWVARHLARIAGEAAWRRATARA